MIVAIGTDIVEHKMTDRLNWKEKPDLLKRIFTEHEIRIFSESKSMQFLYGRFAGKEAVLKCLGTGMIDGLAMTDIQVSKLETGKPTINLSGEVKKISDNMGIKLWHISITHSKLYSIAYVVAEKF